MYELIFSHSDKRHKARKIYENYNQIPAKVRKGIDGVATWQTISYSTELGTFTIFKTDFRIYLGV